MGIRIQKEIGYFLSNQKISLLLVEDYDNILTEISYNDDWHKEYFESLDLVAKEVLSKDEYFMAKFELKFLKDSFDKKEIKLYDLISNLFFGDESEGLLFKTESMVKAKRRDDLIDYYEHGMENTIKYLHCPIYPNSGYVYHGGLEQYDIYPKLEVGKTYADFIGHLARSVNKHIYNDERSVENSVEIGTILTEKGYFSPRISSCMYVLAKTANILKPEVTHTDFNRNLEPVTTTTWS